MKPVTTTLLCVLFLLVVFLCILVFSGQWWNMYNTALKHNTPVSGIFRQTPSTSGIEKTKKLLQKNCGCVCGNDEVHQEALLRFSGYEDEGKFTFTANDGKNKFPMDIDCSKCSTQSSQWDTSSSQCKVFESYSAPAAPSLVGSLGSRDLPPLDPVATTLLPTVSRPGGSAPQVPYKNVCILPNNEDAVDHPRTMVNREVVGQAGRATTGVFDVNYYTTSVAGNEFRDYGLYERYTELMSTLMTLQNYFDYTRDYFYTNSAFAPYQNWLAFSDKFNAVCGQAEKVAGKNVGKTIEEKINGVCALYKKAGILEDMNILAEHGGPRGWYCDSHHTKIPKSMDSLTSTQALNELDKLVVEVQQINLAVTQMKELNQQIPPTLGKAYNSAVITRSLADMTTPSNCYQQQKPAKSTPRGALRYAQTVAINDLPLASQSLIPKQGGTLTTVNRIFLQNPSTPATSLAERYTRKDIASGIIQ